VEEMPAGGTSARDSAIGRNLLAKLDPLSRGHPQQVGDTPDDIVLEFIHSTVGVHNFPHHPNESAATVVVQKLIELAGELKEIDSGPVDRGRFLEQPGGGQFVQIKMRSENGVKLRPPRLRHFAVNGRYTREQCCGRKLELADRGGLPFVLNESRNKSLEGSEHHLSNLLIGQCRPAAPRTFTRHHRLLARESNVRWHSRAFNTTGLRNFNIGCQSRSSTARLPSGGCLPAAT
jgi:hypothetical protein